MSTIPGRWQGRRHRLAQPRRHTALFPPLLHVSVALLAMTIVLVEAAAAGGAAASLPVLLSDGTNGGATARARVEYCGPNSDGAAATTTELGGCTRKLVVDITLDDSTVTGSVLETSVTVSAALDRARFPADETTPADSATAASTLARTLQVTMAPLTLGFRRGGVQMRYALDYLRDFPGALRDNVRALRTATICDDGVTRCAAYTPLGGGGQVVPAPMGICCLCTSVECAISMEMCNASMRTHFCFRTAAAGTICVKEEGVRYGGWAIEAGNPFYALDATVSGAAAPTSTFHLSTDATTVELGPSRMQLLQTADVDTAVAGLRPNLSQRVLFNPLSGDRVAAGAAEWLLVPSALVTVNGTACDRVGVTPEFFYSLSRTSQCNAQQGTCLANQLEDLRAADVDAMAQGGGGSYLASSLGALTQQTVEGRRFLLDAVERTGGATLRFAMNADAMPLDAVAVPGTLTALRFLAATAEVSAVVSNPGAYAGLYYVALRSCTATRVVTCRDDGGGDVCVASLLVRGGNLSGVAFPMWPTSLDGKGGVANCTVELRDAANATLGTASVTWSVVTTTTTTTTTTAPTKRQRCQHCPFHDLRCLFGGVCEWQMLVWTVVALAVTWCPFALLVSWRRVWKLCQ